MDLAHSALVKARARLRDLRGEAGYAPAGYAPAADHAKASLAADAAVCSDSGGDTGFCHMRSLVCRAVVAHVLI